MNFLKKLSLGIVAIVFCLGIFTTVSNAQSRNRSYQNRNDSWGRQQGQNRQWQNRNYRQGRITPQEYQRLQRQRMRLTQTRNRFYRNDGRISPRERVRLARKYSQYRNRVQRDRRDW